MGSIKRERKSEVEGSVAVKASGAGCGYAAFTCCGVVATSRNIDTGKGSGQPDRVTDTCAACYRSCA